MSPPRFRLRTLMVAVVIVGGAFALARAGSMLSFQIIYTLVVVALIVATIAARYRRGLAGAFWFGAAVTGWALFLIGHDQHSDQGARFRPSPFLVTTPLGRALTELINPPPGPKVITPGRIVLDIAAYQEYRDRDRATEGILSMMIVALLAALGGVVAVGIAGRRRQRG